MRVLECGRVVGREKVAAMEERKRKGREVRKVRGK